MNHLDPAKFLGGWNNFPAILKSEIAILIQIYICIWAHMRSEIVDLQVSPCRTTPKDLLPVDQLLRATADESLLQKPVGSQGIKVVEVSVLMASETQKPYLPRSMAFLLGGLLQDAIGCYGML